MSSKYWKPSVSLQWALLRALFLQVKKKNPKTILSAFLHRQIVPASRSLLWPSSWPTPKSPWSSFVGSPRAGYNTPSGISQERSRGIESAPSTGLSHCFLGSPGWLPFSARSPHYSLMSKFSSSSIIKSFYAALLLIPSFSWESWESGFPPAFFSPVLFWAY